MRAHDQKRPQILSNRYASHNGGMRPLLRVRIKPLLAIAMLALPYNDSIGIVKDTSNRMRFTLCDVTTACQSKGVGDSKRTRITAITGLKRRSVSVRFAFCRARRRFWHGVCITPLSITQASSRWLFCEPRRRPHNLSVCDSKQTVAAVWRPCPSRETARITQPGRLRCRGGHPAPKCRMQGRVDGTGTTLGETLVRLGSPDASSRRCIAESRHPPPEPDDAVHRAAAVPPIRGPGWHSPRRANRVLIFFARYDFNRWSSAAIANRQFAATTATPQRVAAPVWEQSAQPVAFHTRGESYPPANAG